MSNEERKLVASSLVPLEIDPTSILSLSKGVIFDTIVHNIEHTFSNRRTDPLPWKLVGMSLICDANRNKKYLQKLQKMQCVPSAICTRIYHSKLVKNDNGILATFGRKIILPTVPRKRLTGVIVCRSIDELLYMEREDAENIHIVQYKLLSYERIITQEIISGPKIPSVHEKILKAVFDFELSQSSGFPRQLLPVAIISFAKQQNCDLCLSIRNFLNLDEHKVFDKSYLATSTNVEIDRLREDQQRKNDSEIEKILLNEQIQKRKPLADLSRKSTDVTNTRLSTLNISSRVPPLKIKLPCSEKVRKPSTQSLPLDATFKCSLKLNRIDLSLYDISNLTTISDSINRKSKSLIITKPHEHNKHLKRLNTYETNRQSSPSTSISESRHYDDTISNPSSLSDFVELTITNRTNEQSPSGQSMSPIYRPKPNIRKISIDSKKLKKKKNVKKREALPVEYKCSVSLTRIDLSTYDLDLSSYTNLLPINTTSTTIASASASHSSSLQTDVTNSTIDSENIRDPLQSIFLMELENIQKSNGQIVPDTQQFDDINTSEVLTNIIDDFLTPDLNGLLSDVINEILPASTNEISSDPLNQDMSKIKNEIFSQTMNDVAQKTDISHKPNTELMSSKTSAILSPDLATLDSDPLFPSNENSDIIVQDCLIIVPCSDDEDDASNSDEAIRNELNTVSSNDSSDIFQNRKRFKNHLSSTSSNSSLSVSILHHPPNSPLDLTKIYLPRKVLTKQQSKSSRTINFNRLNISIPLVTQEPLIDPRLIYRLQAITIDLRWPMPCNQCSMSANNSIEVNSTTQTRSHEKTSTTNFADPRRDSLKTAILNHIYHRIKILIPNLFIVDSNQFQKLLFEQTIFKTNCSLHLEYLLAKIKLIDDNHFFRMMKNNDEFQLSPLLLQLIFN